MLSAGTVAAKRDAVVSAVLIVVGLAAIFRINTVGTSRAVVTQSLTHASLPTLYASLLVLLSAVMLIGALRVLLRRPIGARDDALRPSEGGTATDHSSFLVRWLGTLAALVVFALLLPHVPFLLLTTVFLASLFWLFGRTGLVKVAAASIIGGSAFYLLFVVFLRLPF
jgi:hypothetical protein